MSYQLHTQLQPFVLGWDQYCFVFAEDEFGETNQFLVNYAGEILDSGDLDVVPDDLLKLIQSAAKEAFDHKSDDWAIIENMLVWTQHFFHRHWNNRYIGKEPPKWSAPIPINAMDSLQDSDNQSLYACLKDHHVVNLYLGRGKSVDQNLTPSMGKHLEVMRIEFERDEAYLAKALEQFLVVKMLIQNCSSR